MEFQAEGCWGARRMWCFIARVEYRGIIILLDLEIQKKKKKSIIISVVGLWCGQCDHFLGKIILSFQKKKKQLRRHGLAYSS